MRSRFFAISIAALLFAPEGAVADAIQTQSASGQQAPEQFAAQTPSTDGFVHIRLSPDLGDDLPALKAQLEQMPGVRIGDPADYELTNIRDFPATLLAIDQHQGEADWEQGFLGQELLEEHPHDFEDHPRTVILGNLVLGDYAEALRTLVARTSTAKTLIALGQRGAKDEIETCVKSTYPDAPDGRVGVQCHPGPYREPETDMGISPDDISYYGSKILVRNRSDRPLNVVVFLIDPAFGTNRLDFAAHAKFALLAPGAAAEAQSLAAGENPLAGRYRLITIWSDQPFDPDALPSTFLLARRGSSFIGIWALGRAGTAACGAASSLTLSRHVRGPFRRYLIEELWNTMRKTEPRTSTRSMSAASGKRRIAAARP